MTFEFGGKAKTVQEAVLPFGKICVSGKFYIFIQISVEHILLPDRSTLHGIFVITRFVGVGTSVVLPSTDCECEEVLFTSIMTARSPYFDRGRSKTPSPRSRSDYFAQSCTSFFGCAETLGSLVEALGGKVSVTKLCPARQNFHSRPVCVECQIVLDPVVALFSECPSFSMQWKEVLTLAKESHPDQQNCWQQLEPHLEECVRHLCDKQCFLKAFAPYRQRFVLQRRLTESPDVSPGASLLDGWSCRLVTESRPPRILFEDGDGNIFGNTSSVLNVCGTKVVASTMGAVGKRKPEPSIGTVLLKCTHIPLETSVLSPLGLLEELFADDPWRLLLSTIFLNRTSRVQVDHILNEFLDRWPTPKDVLEASFDDIVQVIRPLGICYRRADGVKRFSRDYLRLVQDSTDLFNLTERDIKGMHQCGAYAYDAYRIFIQRDSRVEPSDIELRTYVEYKASLKGVVDMKRPHKALRLC